MKIKCMLAIVLLMVFIAGSALAGPKEVILERYAEGFQKGSPVWNSWRDGLKEQGLSLDSVNYTMKVLQEEKATDGTSLVAEVAFIAFCYDISGARKRYINHKILIYIFDLECNIAGIYVLDSVDEVKNGWSNASSI